MPTNPLDGRELIIDWQQFFLIHGCKLCKETTGVQWLEKQFKQYFTLSKCNNLHKSYESFIEGSSYCWEKDGKYLYICFAKGGTHISQISVKNNDYDN